METFVDHQEDDELVVNRYVPESLGALCDRTHYNVEEIRIIYRAFKQECPTGIVYEHQFKELYAQYFPLGGKTRSMYLVNFRLVILIWWTDGSLLLANTNSYQIPAFIFT